ncbi:MAG: ATP-binding protein [Kineosporiaceae bacterium]
MTREPADIDLASLVALLRRRRTDLPSVEAKSAAGGLPRSVRETVSAFSNDRGGLLLLGLDEQASFAVAPGMDAVSIRDALASLCSDAFEPPVRAEIDIHDFEGGQVVVATIPELDQARKPCYVKAKGMTGGSYTRGGDGDRLLTPYEIYLLHANRGQPRDDHEVVPEAGPEDLDPDAVARLLRRVRRREPAAFAAVDDETALIRLGVLRRGAPRPGVTLAGLITLGQWPQQYLPQLCVTFIAVPGVHKDAIPEGAPRFTDNATIRGPLPQMIEDTVQVILRNTMTAAHVHGVGREDVGEYPVEALREAVTNALAHRDYSQHAHGTQVQVELYSDRLVVRNPGGLFGTVTPDDLGQEGVSSSRNGYLIPLLSDVYLPGTDRVVADNRGSGIPDMLARLRRANLSLPTFDSRLSRFTVTFPRHTLLTPETVAWIESLGEPGLSRAQVNALALMREGRPVSNATLRQMGLDGREATAALSDLVSRRLAYRVGGRRYAEYLLHDEGPAQEIGGTVSPRSGVGIPLPGRHGLPTLRYDRSAEILGLFDTGRTLTAAQVRQMSGLGAAMANRYLSRLVASGMLLATAPPRSPNRAYRAP